jgi:hypothetical protein
VVVAGFGFALMEVVNLMSWNLISVGCFDFEWVLVLVIE